MPRARIVRQSPVIRTPRVMQMEGIFDVPPSERTAQEWEVNLPLDEKEWNIGLIVGPSGSGKTTVARELFGNAIADNFAWSDDKSILDDFPREMGIKDIIELLSSVGFSSPPSWVKPYRVLSTGEQFRVHVARTLAEQKELAVIDEFTSVVDRTVAQIGSAAVSKAVRRRNQKMIAVACHYDIIEWLTPDWIYQPHTNEFAWRSERRRPPIELQIKRVHASAWQLYKRYHYLDTNLHKAARCFVAFWNNTPVAFASSLPMPHPIAKNIWREHRVVCLPDYQGAGIGNAISECVASMYTGIGKRYTSVTSNPAMVGYRNKSDKWKMIQKPSTAPVWKGIKGGVRNTFANAKTGRNRLAASFEYIGAPMERAQALALLGK